MVLAAGRYDYAVGDNALVQDGARLHDHIVPQNGAGDARGWIDLRAVRNAGSAGRGTRIDGSARLTQSILWDDVDVGAGVQLDECIVTDGVQLPPGATHRRQILVRGDDGATRVSPLIL